MSKPDTGVRGEVGHYQLANQCDQTWDLSVLSRQFSLQIWVENNRDLIICIFSIQIYVSKGSAVTPRFSTSIFVASLWADN